MSNTTGVLQEEGTAYPSRAHEFTPIFGGVSVVPLFRFLCCPVMRLIVPCCDVRLDSCIQTMFGVSLPSCHIYVICVFI